MSAEETLFDQFTSTWEAERQGFVRCRTMGHAWFDVAGTWTPSFGTPMTFHCERCGTERRDLIDTNGNLAARYYLKPQGYDLGKEDFKPSRSDFRLMLLAIRQRGNTTPKRVKWTAK